LAKAFKTLLALPGPEEEKTDRQFITALARGLEVLRAFEPGDGFLGNLEIAERTRLPKPTIARITHTLTTLGYLDYNRRLEKYALGTPVLSLGYACLSNIGLRRVARPHMQELADFANISVALGNRDRLNLAYLELAHGSATVSLRLDVGARVPIHRSAMGMAYLHALPPAEREFLVDAIRKHDEKEFPKFKKRLSAAFKELDATGYCVGLGLYERTVNGVGAALRMREGGSIYAFNCSGPSFQLTEEFIRSQVGPRLVTMVQNIELDLLHQPVRF
jgi:DNA-binding IclR family transcriptional regulator